MADALFIGIDGGGTNCRARLRDEAGRLIGEGSGGPANVRLDSKLVMDSILTASRAAARQGGLREDELSGAHAGFGLAGAGQRPACQKLLAEPHPFASITIETDAYAAWLGAHGGRDGAILILGTGSCGFAVVNGQQHYVSGWGAEVSDEASGVWIGRELLRRTLWAFDGRATMTPLAESVLGRFGHQPDEIVAFGSSARAADFGRFVPLVFEHLRSRDPLALALVAEAAADAARMMMTLLDRGARSVCLLGGLAGSLEPWLPPPLREHLAEPLADATEGAILLARRAYETTAPALAQAG